MKEDLSFIDIGFTVREMQALVGARLDKVYQPTKSIVIIQMYKTELGQFTLKVALPNYVTISEFKEKIPEKPSQFVMFLRKFLSGGKITKVVQVPFERIIEIHIDRLKEIFFLYIELFSKGNMILCTSKNSIIAPMLSQSWSSREVRANNPYKTPPQKYEFSSMDLEKFSQAIKSSDKDQIVKVLAVDFLLGGEYAEEICAESGVEKTMFIGDLQDQHLLSIFDKYNSLLTKVMSEEIKPEIIFDEFDQEISVTPFPFVKYTDFKSKKYSSFNEALDQYFATLNRTGVHAKKEREILSQIRRYEKMLAEHQEYINDLESRMKYFKESGDAVYMHFTQIEHLLKTILTARDKYEWDEIISRLEKAKESGNKDALLMRSIEPSKCTIILNIGDGIVVDFTQDVSSIANRFYSESKKLGDKIPGVERQMEDINSKLSAVRERVSQIDKEVEKAVPAKVVKKKKEWFEKFIWFRTKNNFLCAGGRDATQNEIIVKKHSEPDDIIFHTESPGSPFAVLKDGKSATKEDIREAALFVLCHSKAWKNNFVSEVYYISPEQASKKAPSGEYVAHGGFTINGKKNFVPDMVLKYAVGLLMPSGTVISGPIENVSSKTKYVAVLVPGKMDKDEVSKAIKEKWSNEAKEEDIKTIKKVSLDEIKEHALQSSEFA